PADDVAGRRIDVLEGFAGGGVLVAAVDVELLFRQVLHDATPGGGYRDSLAPAPARIWGRGRSPRRRRGATARRAGCRAPWRSGRPVRWAPASAAGHERGCCARAA